MNHFLISSSDRASMDNIEKAVQTMDVHHENITDLCCSPEVTIDKWLTPNILRLISMDAIVVTLLVSTAMFVAASFQIQPFIIWIGAVITVLFTFWLSGLLVLQHVKHYLTCRQILEFNPGSQAILVEADDEQSNKLERMLEDQIHWTFRQID